MRQDIASKVFSPDDQEAFARLSGDYNPMHMDPLAARRTQAGVPVVHGIHLLAWFLDAAAGLAGRDFVGTLKVRFEKFVAVGEPVRAVVTQLDAAALRGEVCVGSLAMVRIALQFTPPAAAPPPQNFPPLEVPAPLDLALEDMAGRTGTLAPAVAPAVLQAAFPAAARALGPTRLSALMGLTYLVGMVCPGLHSIFGGLALTACDTTEGDAHLAFEVRVTDPRFRMVKMNVWGGGWTGTVDSFVRHKPVAQASVAALRGVVRPDEFAGRRALIVGGSRGLGELTAKLIAAGGGQVRVTYASGKADADRVAGDIAEAGGRCEVLRYDVSAAAAAQLTALETAPTSLYYMATPAIFRRKSGLFDRARFDEFMTFYVTAFWELCAALRDREPGLAVFYPSSVAVESRPADMTEYAMAKAAGEVLCADAARFLAPMRVVMSRLPRLPTDQTATLLEVDTADPLETMLPLIRAVELAGRRDEPEQARRA
jgi:acyl dehydratase/NAD(P)-dependent dehydrogenase (short-subunit alcohol dehydrogenase family)